MSKKRIKAEFSKKIQEIILSDKTAEDIGNICGKCDIANEEKIENIAYQIGIVLLGRLSPEKLAKTLEKKVKLKSKIAKKVSEEVNKLIFSPIKDDLAKLYEKEVFVKPVVKPGNSVLPPLKEEPKRSPRKDTYREPIE